jgi:hypothetical protein
MRGRVGKAEVSVVAGENLMSAASAPGAANLAKKVPSGEGRKQRKRACPLKLKRIERRERSGGRRDSGLGLHAARWNWVLGYWGTGYYSY